MGFHSSVTVKVGVVDNIPARIVVQLARIAEKYRVSIVVQSQESTPDEHWK